MLGDKQPNGIIPKFSPRDKHHRQLFAGHDDAPYLLTTFKDSAWFVNRPEEMDKMLSPSQELILANVEPDEFLVGRTPDDEIRRLEAIQPDYYIPSDRWVYEDTMTSREQLEEIDRCLRGTREVTERIRARSDLSTRIIPIVKGWKAWHFERSRQTLDDLSLSYCAFDVTQYNSRYRIIEDVERLIEVINPSEVLLIGRLGSKTLRDCPREVVAASGLNQWFKNSKGSHSKFDRDAYSDWAVDANEDLASVQTDLGDFTQSTHKQLSD